MEQELNQPAFPVVQECGVDDPKMNGMTLRDYFAIRATEEEIARNLGTGKTILVIEDDGLGNKRETYKPEYVSREKARYRFADAMMEARK